jgi:hypothetical protein
VTLVAATIAVGGVANAYWVGSGDGAGSGRTGTNQNVTLAPATAGDGLYPGGTTDVALSIRNPNATPVRIGSLELDTSRGAAGFAVDPPHSACTPLSVLSMSTQSNGGTGWTVPARSGGTDGELAVTLTGALGMSAQGANGCQGASFTVYLRAIP